MQTELSLHRQAIPLKTVILFIDIFIHLCSICWCTAYPIPHNSYTFFPNLYTQAHDAVKQMNTKHSIHLLIPHKSLQHFLGQEILHMPSDKMYVLQNRLRGYSMLTLSALRGLDLTLHDLIATYTA